MSGVNVRTFLDTNVLAYTDDADSPAKRATALTLIEEAQSTRTGVVSVQVLTEYMSVATRKLHVPVAVAARKVALFAQLEVVP
jgi:predicted nucleic acid-binding protein